MQEPYVCPPLTSTSVQVQSLQVSLPQAMTMLYPELETASDPSMLSSVRSVMGMPLVGVPLRSPPS